MHPKPREAMPAVQVMRHLGLMPDPWQVEVLESDHPRILLNCCRQAGKSTVVAVLALVEALFRPLSKVVILSRSHRQAMELLRQIRLYHVMLREKLKGRTTSMEMDFTNLSRIISLPCKEETIRGYAHVDLMILDEAARVPDDLYRAVRPMLAVSKGRLICLSTPHGKHGFFWNAWARGGADWKRIEIPAAQCPRISADFLAEERRALGESWYRQEYECSFEAIEGLVYPDFAKCVVTELPEDIRFLIDDFRWNTAAGQAEARQLTPRERVQIEIQKSKIENLQLVGGIDFGFRNPFAAIWGVVDRDDVLWLVGEHYGRYKPLSFHAQHLPRNVIWYADPSGANEIGELRVADFVVRRGNNAIRLGITAIHARLQAGTLKVLKMGCPNLIAEAGLYRFSDHPEDRRNETPVDDHNHALGALRYLLTRIDARKMARWEEPTRGQDEERWPKVG